MKWILFTGTWKLTNQEVEDDVREAVREVLSQGNRIVTGGATGGRICVNLVEMRR